MRNFILSVRRRLAIRKVSRAADRVSRLADWCKNDREYLQGMNRLGQSAPTIEARHRHDLKELEKLRQRMVAAMRELEALS